MTIASTMSAYLRTRMRKALPPTSWTTMCPGRKAARRARVMAAQKRLIRTRNRQRRGELARVLIDGPASDHELVLRGRLETRLPTSMHPSS